MTRHELTERIQHRGRGFMVEYYSKTGARGVVKYFALITMGSSDKVILDNESLFGLKAIVNILCPILVDSRMTKAS